MQLKPKIYSRLVVAKVFTVHVASLMACLNDLPVEVLEKILQLLAGNPVSVRRAGLVCHQWADIVHNLLLRGRITCNPKVNNLGES